MNLCEILFRLYQLKELIRRSLPHRMFSNIKIEEIIEHEDRIDIKASAYEYKPVEYIEFKFDKGEFSDK